jgi:hypothetical protein
MFSMIEDPEPYQMADYDAAKPKEHGKKFWGE